MSIRDPTPKIPMPIKVKPYKHQIEAFNFVCEMFGLVTEGGAADDDSYCSLHRMRESYQPTEKSGS